MNTGKEKETLKFEELKLERSGTDSLVKCSPGDEKCSIESYRIEVLPQRDGELQERERELQCPSRGLSVKHQTLIASQGDPADSQLPQRSNANSPHKLNNSDKSEPDMMQERELMGGNNCDGNTQIGGSESAGKVMEFQSDLRLKSEESRTENKSVETGENTAQKSTDKMSEIQIINESTEDVTGDHNAPELANGMINGPGKIDVTHGVNGRIIGEVFLPPGETLASTFHDGSDLAQMDASRECIKIEVGETLSQPFQDVSCEITEMESYSPQTVEESIISQVSVCSPQTAGESQLQIDSCIRSDTVSVNISSYHSKDTQIMTSSSATQEASLSQGDSLIASLENTNTGSSKNSESNIESSTSEIKSSPTHIKPSIEPSPAQIDPAATQVEPQPAQMVSLPAQISCLHEAGTCSSVECLSPVNHGNLDAPSSGVNAHYETNNPPSNQGQNDSRKSEINEICGQNKSCNPALVVDNGNEMSQMEGKSSFETEANPLHGKRSGIAGSELDQLSGTYQGIVSEGVVHTQLPERGSWNQIAEHEMTFVPEMSHENNVRSSESHCYKTDMMCVTCESRVGSGRSHPVVIKSSQVGTEFNGTCQEKVGPGVSETRGDDPSYCNGMQLNAHSADLTLESKSEAANPDSCPVKGDDSIEVVPPTQVPVKRGGPSELSSDGAPCSELMSVCHQVEGDGQEFMSACELLSEILDATVRQVEEAVRISGNSLHLNTWTSDTMQDRQGLEGLAQGQGHLPRSRSHGSESGLVSCLHHSTEQCYETQAREPLNVSFASPLTEHHTYSPCPTPSPSQASTINLYDDEAIELSRSEVASYFDNRDTGNSNEQCMDIDLSCNEMERQDPQLFYDIWYNEDLTRSVNQGVKQPMTRVDEGVNQPMTGVNDGVNQPMVGVNRGVNQPAVIQQMSGANQDTMFKPIKEPLDFLPIHSASVSHNVCVASSNQVFKEKSFSPHATRPQTSAETSGRVEENYEHHLNSVGSGENPAQLSSSSVSAFYHVKHGRTEHVSYTTQTAPDIQAQLREESKLPGNYGNKIEIPKIAEDLPLNGSCELFDSPEARDNLDGFHMENELPSSGQAECKASIPCDPVGNEVPLSDRSASPELFSQTLNDSALQRSPVELQPETG